MKVQVTKRAQAQIDRAARWWDDNRPLAPKAFDEDLSEVFWLLSIEPGIGVPLANARTPGVKRLLLARIHYFLYYRVRGEEVAKQLRCWVPAALRAPSPGQRDRSLSPLLRRL